MYDWIPMEFDFWYRWDDISYDTYHCITNDNDKSTFQVFKDGAGCVNSAYYLSDLMKAMKHGSQINGMSLAELKSCHFEEPDADIDISHLL